MTLHLLRHTFEATYTLSDAWVSDETGAERWRGTGLELEVEANAKGDDAIPAGTYVLSWTVSPRLNRHTLRVEGVPGRSGILIHPANSERELRGCIALGHPALPGSTLRIINSRRAVGIVEGLRPTRLVITEDRQ